MAVATGRFSWGSASPAGFRRSGLRAISCADIDSVRHGVIAPLDRCTAARDMNADEFMALMQGRRLY